MKLSLNILIIEDNEDDYDLLIRKLERDKVSIKSLRVEEESSLLEALKNDSFDIVISDNTLPKLDAQRALKIVRSLDQNIPFIIVSGTIPEKTAIESMYEGASDFLLKNNLSKLTPIVLREVKDARIRSEKFHVESKLLLSEESYQALAQSITDVFFAIDTDFKITYWNDASHREFNIARDKVSGKSIYEVFPFLENSKLNEEVVKGITLKSARYTSFKYSKKIHGIDSVEYYDGSIYPTDNGASVILKKVTEKRKAEASFIKINKELETLIYRLSHDIQGPMSSIMGLINIGKMECKDKQITDLLQKQEDAAVELNKTLKALMNISQIKKDELVFERLVFKSVIDNVMSRLKYIAGYNFIQVVVDVDPKHSVVSDRNLLESILQNLIENSIKYRTKNKPNLLIETARHSRCLYISVIDNGIGIPMDQQNKVFDMFFRASENSTGSGLGLYVVKSSVEKLQGSVSMKSVPGKGCRFDIIIPDLQEKNQQTLSA